MNSVCRVERHRVTASAQGRVSRRLRWTRERAILVSRERLVHLGRRGWQQEHRGRQEAAGAAAVRASRVESRGAAHACRLPLSFVPWLLRGRRCSFSRSSLASSVSRVSGRRTAAAARSYTSSLARSLSFRVLAPRSLLCRSSGSTSCLCKLQAFAGHPVSLRCTASSII